MHVWKNLIYGEDLILILNMRIQLKNDPSVSIFFEQLLDIGNSQIHLYEDTQYIRLPEET